MINLQSGLRLQLRSDGGTVDLRPAEQVIGRSEHEPEVHEAIPYGIELVSPENFGSPEISIQDIVLPDPDSKETRRGGEVVWGWEPHRWFRLCFGVTHLEVEFLKGPRMVFEPIEVLASRIVADEARGMLEYLWNQSPEMIHACFARTSVEVAQGSAPPSINRILHAGEKVLNALRPILFSPVRRMRTQLVERIVRKELKPTDLIDDRCIYDALRGLQSVTSASAYDAPQIRFGGKTFSLKYGAAVEKFETSDVYENGAIHGILQAMERRLISVRNEIERVRKEVEGSGRKQEAASVRFKHVCGYFIYEAFRGPLQELEHLLKRVRHYKHQAHAVVPARPVHGMPRRTPYFLANQRYRRFFVAARHWYKVGDGLSNPAEILFGLRTMDRLFEYLVLFKMLEVFQGLGWALAEASVRPSPFGHLQQINNFFVLRHHEIGTLTLYYEAQIPTRANRSEGAASVGGLEKATGSSRFSYEPDYILELENRAGTKVRAVLDAKYTSEQYIEKYLTDITWKYLHGVHLPGRTFSLPFDHVWVITPSGHVMKSHHYQAHDIVWPTLGSIKLIPSDKGEGVARWYRRILLPVLRLMEQA